ncbi:response regulator [bacterium]|nr:MAG: response regulator [bacterium]
MAYIVHIDDNEIDRLVVKRALERELKGIKLLSFCDVRTAEEFLMSLQKQQDDMPDLIITDNNMPEKTGFMFLEFHRTSKELNKIPVMMLSSSTQEKDIQKAYNLGAVSYMAKPVKPGTIDHIVNLLKNKI